ncbi:putative ankyrin repeat-containing protein [Hibiscus syriacus]|uniref:Ankyrin repeat-containing protein n=1 Tax=Hibiscus syriacus TaxID=106335 RepID=A0A6A3B4M2_HIBSY|nr:putative ankyrin repeat-containing protein [Hibiscus syriacus]
MCSDKSGTDKPPGITATTIALTILDHVSILYIAWKLVFPVNYEEEVSQRLIDALNGNDSKLACECLADPFVDVNFVGTVNLKSMTTDISLHDEAADEVLVDYEEFKTEVTPL